MFGISPKSGAKTDCDAAACDNQKNRKGFDVWHVHQAAGLVVEVCGEAVVQEGVALEEYIDTADIGHLTAL